MVGGGPSSDVPRRRVVGGTALGLTTLVLPGATAAASTVTVAGWSSALSFSEVTPTGFRVTWTPVA